jgi:hypothetical protein
MARTVENDRSLWMEGGITMLREQSFSAALASYGKDAAKAAQRANLKLMLRERRSALLPKHRSATDLVTASAVGRSL